MIKLLILMVLTTVWVVVAFGLDSFLIEHKIINALVYVISTVLLLLIVIRLIYLIAISIPIIISKIKWLRDWLVS